MGQLNYVKVFADGTSEATLVKPAYGIYEREFAGDNRDTYHNGKWYPVTGGEELVTNGTFNTDISGWTSYGGASLSYTNSALNIGAVPGTGAYVSVTTVIGEEYIVKYNILTTGGARLYVGSSVGLVDVADNNSNNTYSTNTDNQVGEYEYGFIATSTTSFIMPYNQGASASYFDNISVYKAKPTLGEPYPTQFTYLSKDGKLAEIEVANGEPVDIHLNELAPTLVEDTIQAKNIISDNYTGKNACTAWVNFDGSTTPPTIRDSFNVSDVVRVNTGDFEFVTDLDISGISIVVGGHQSENPIYTGMEIAAGTYNGKVRVAYRRTGNTAINPSEGFVQIFGGKN